MNISDHAGWTTYYTETTGKCGDFNESKKNPGVFGLKNDSTTIWNVEYPGKEPMTYEGGKVVTVIPDTVITIGNKKVVIEKTEIKAQA